MQTTLKKWAKSVQKRFSNKYIEKYIKLKGKSGSEISAKAKELSKEALVLQPKIEKIIMKTDSPLNDIECKKLI
ncbi:hypothetical protein [Acinetobacter pittii]|uniref:hypothetical protein n=1 Tax=Acinetobacter pittii TaxID=48296 RepID=UPI000F79D251|nr:hypothetical protein [Acinetobacter pittii]